MQHSFSSLSLPLCECVCWLRQYSGFKSMLCFIFYHSLWETEVLATLLAVSPASAPSLLSSPDFHLGIWGSRDADSTSTSQILSPFCWKVSPLILPFLIQSKNNNKKQQSCHTGAARLGCSGALLLQPHLLQSPTHLSLLFTAPLTLPETFQALLYLPIFSHPLGL